MDRVRGVCSHPTDDQALELGIMSGPAISSALDLPSKSSISLSVKTMAVPGPRLVTSFLWTTTSASSYANSSTS